MWRSELLWCQGDCGDLGVFKQLTGGALRLLGFLTRSKKKKNKTQRQRGKSQRERPHYKSTQ